MHLVLQQVVVSMDIEKQANVLNNDCSYCHYLNFICITPFYISNAYYN